MAHPALSVVAHRPWPLPDRPWALTMRWEELLFLHWRVPAVRLRQHLPPGLELELFDGSAWLGVVPFRMAATRWRWLPPVPGTHRFPELNVRTYVHAHDRPDRPGVWFFSLDATSAVVVAAARCTFGLPYLCARMACERHDSWVRYRSERTDRRGAPAGFAGEWRAAGPPAVATPGSLEHFLVERYCLYTMHRGRLRRGDIAHGPWQLAPAEVRRLDCAMTQPLGFGLVGPPESALVTAPQTVAAWSPRP